MLFRSGFAGQKIVSNSFEKVKQLAKYLNENKKTNIEIEVDGNISIENAQKLYQNGANIFVAGSSSLFSKTELSTSEIILKKRQAIGWNEYEK